MALKKKQVNLSIMQSTDQITADKVSMNPSEILNTRFDKNGEASKRLGVNFLNSMSGDSIVVGVNDTPYVGSANGFYGIDPEDDDVKFITDTPFVSMGLQKKRTFSSNSEIIAMAHARGENYHFAVYRFYANVGALQETKAFLLDDDFQVVRDLTDDIPGFLSNDFIAAQCVSYAKNGFEYVTILVQDAAGYIRATDYDENGDAVGYSPSSVTGYPGPLPFAATSTGTGYFVGQIIAGTNQFTWTEYDGSTYTTATSISTVYAGYCVGSLAYFPDYLIVTINPEFPNGATTQAKLLQIPLATFPAAMSPIVYSLIVGGAYLPKWATVTTVDNSNYVLSLTDYDDATIEHRSYIKRNAKTTVSGLTSGGILTERSSSIGKAYINPDENDDYAYVMLMTQNGYNPIYHMVRVDISQPSTSYYRNMISFLSGEAPTSEFYAVGMPGQNPVEGRAQYLYRAQPTFSRVGNKIFTIVPVQPLGDEWASWKVLEFEFKKSSKSIQAEGVSALATGVFSTWDGSSLIRGVTCYPEIQTTNASGSGINYVYIPLYKILDGNGNVVRSLPGPSFSITAATAIGTLPVQVTFASKALLFNDYPSTSNNPYNGTWELYRTEHNGTVFYKVDSSLASSTGILDGVDDSNLIDNELLYTTGGVLENAYPSIVEDFAFSNGRLWTVGDNDKILYSKETVEGNAIEFSDGLIYRIPAGKNVAIGRLGKRQAVFKQRSCYLMWGTPASNIGTGQNLTHQEVSSSIGCVNPATVLEIEPGIMFESEKGVYLLTNAGSLQFIGKDIIDYTNDLSIMGAAHLEDRNEAIYSMSDGSQLVYNYLFGVWDRDIQDLTQALDHVYRVGNTVFYLAKQLSATTDYLFRDKTLSDDAPYSDRAGAYSDYQMIHSTGWLKFGGMAGFQRCYRLFVVGSKTTDQSIRVSVYNDYNDTTPSQIKDFALLAADPLEFELHVAQQKGESIKFVIEELMDETNGDLKINSLALQIGVKKGFNKLSPDLRQ